MRCGACPALARQERWSGVAPLRWCAGDGGCLRCRYGLGQRRWTLPRLQKLWQLLVAREIDFLRGAMGRKRLVDFRQCYCRSLLVYQQGLLPFFAHDQVELVRFDQRQLLGLKQMLMQGGRERRIGQAIWLPKTHWEAMTLPCKSERFSNDKKHKIYLT